MHTFWSILVIALLAVGSYFIYRHNAGRQHAGGPAPQRTIAPDPKAPPAGPTSSKG